MAIGDWLSSFVPTANTALYLQLNNNANDSSANANNGSPTDVLYVAGRFGQAGSFNGSSSYILVANSTSIKPTSLSPKTVSVWFKNSSTYSPYWVLWNGWYEWWVAANSSWFLALTNNNLIRITGDWTNVLDASFNHNDWNWHLCTAIFRSVGAKIYIDGQLLASGNINLNSSASTLAPTVGNLQYWVWNPWSFFAGLKDDLFVDDWEWSASQIQKYYMNSIGKYNLITH